MPLLSSLEHHRADSRTRRTNLIARGVADGAGIESPGAAKGGEARQAFDSGSTARRTRCSGERRRPDTGG